MPTSEDILRRHALRGRFLACLWDLEQDGRDHTQVDAILDASNDANLPEESRKRLVNDLVADHMVQEYFHMEEEEFPSTIRLTSSGRYEVEEWVHTDRTTQHLPVPYSTVINYNATTINGSVQGSTFVSSSQNVSVSNQSAFGSDLARLVEQARELLQQLSLSSDEYEEAEADLATLAEEADADQPRMARVRAALRRVTTWTGTAVATGGAAALSSEVTQVAQHLLSLAI